MTVSSHVLTLRKKHQELSEEIEEAQKGLASDDLHVTEMKKRKLKIKEEISSNSFSYLRIVLSKQVFKLSELFL